jgi:hypothetical protein
MDAKAKAIDIGFHLYLEEEGKEFGAVRQVAPGGRDELIVSIPSEGNFIVPLRAVRSAHDAKVILDPAQLDKRVLEAISHARHREPPGP